MWGGVALLLAIWYDIGAMSLITGFTKLIGLGGYYKAVPLADLAVVVGVPESTLRRAAGDKRLKAGKVGNVWIASPAAVDRAVRAGKMRRRE